MKHKELYFNTQGFVYITKLNKPQYNFSGALEGALNHLCLSPVQAPYICFFCAQPCCLSVKQ